jgi:hypothetical protein
VAPGAEGQHEDRTRVVCHLPLNNAQEEKAFKDIIEYLQAQRRKRIGVDGYTYSAPTAFSGRWWSAQEGNWMGDRIVLLLIDYRVDLANVKVSLSEEIAQLRQTIRNAYAQRGRPQEEIWVVAFPVTRYT